MKAVGLDEPFFVARGEGAYLEDVDGTRYLDWVHVVGAAALRPRGSARRSRRSATAATRGTSFGAPTEAEVELAAEIVDAVPSVERVRLVSSGTEAAMSAIRLARAFTKRDRILKFAGCYHGHADALLASAGSGLATLGIPSTPGVPTGGHRRHDRLPVQRRRRGRRGGAALRRRPRVRSSSSRSPGTWASFRRRPGFLEALRDAVRRVGRAARLRRGDHRLPRRARRRAGAATASRPTSPCSARSSAAGCRSRRSADART